jgi:hypothetical protein
MKVARSFLVSAPRDQVWELFCDVPRTAACIEAVRSIEHIADDVYEGAVHVRVGPMSFTFDGRVELLAMDAESFCGALRAQAKDPRTAAALAAELRFGLCDVSDVETELSVTLDVKLTGKLAELGQPLIQRKIAELLSGFGRRVEALLKRVERADLARDA